MWPCLHRNAWEEKDHEVELKSTRGLPGPDHGILCFTTRGNVLPDLLAGSEISKDFQLRPDSVALGLFHDEVATLLFKVI